MNLILHGQSNVGVSQWAEGVDGVGWNDRRACDCQVSLENSQGVLASQSSIVKGECLSAIGFL